MKKKLKNDILTIFSAWYKIPGQYAIWGIILFSLWKTTNDTNPYAGWFLLLMLICFVLEGVSIVVAGERLLQKIIKFF